MLRQIDDEDHEHDPRDIQIRRNYIFNPCCCMSVKVGTGFVGICSIFIAVLDIVLTYELEVNTRYNTDISENVRDIDPFYPQNIPYSSSSSLRELERYGCSGALVFTSICLAYAVKWASHFSTLIMCVLWIGVRTLCILIRLVSMGTFLKSSYDFIRNRGYQILTMEGVEAYFMSIVIFYSFHVYEDLKDIRAVAPFTGNIENVDDELHLDEIIRMHGQEESEDQHLGQKIDYMHMDVNEFRLQVEESRMSRLNLISSGIGRGTKEAKRSSFNEEEYQSFKGSVSVLKKPK